MEIKGTKIIPAVPERQEETTLKTVCDLCRKSEGLEPAYNGEVKWMPKTPFDIAKTTIACVLGESYPECGQSISEVFHICPECFNKKLVPWLQEQGAESTEIQKDW